MLQSLVIFHARFERIRKGFLVASLLPSSGRPGRGWSERNQAVSVKHGEIVTSGDALTSFFITFLDLYYALTDQGQRYKPQPFLYLRLVDHMSHFCDKGLPACPEAQELRDRKLI